MPSKVPRLVRFCWFLLLGSSSQRAVSGFCTTPRPNPNVLDADRTTTRVAASLSLLLQALSSDYLENDLVAVRLPQEDPSGDDDETLLSSRLCVVRPDGTVLPLCRHEDDVETDLFSDPRVMSDSFWQTISDSDVTGTYGEGWYGQRPVPSLGGGPGYGAEADETWSVDLQVLEQLAADGVHLPVLDVGIAHGEKARGGALF